MSVYGTRNWSLAEEQRQANLAEAARREQEAWRAYHESVERSTEKGGPVIEGEYTDVTAQRQIEAAKT